MKNKLNIRFQKLGFLLIILFSSIIQAQMVYNTNDTEPMGPDLERPATFPNLRSGEFDKVLSVLNLHSEVFRDKNPNSNYHYYLPREYMLRRNKENGYALNIQYLSSEDNKRGSVLVSLEITSNIDYRKIEFIEKYVYQNFRKRIKLLPIKTYGKPEVDFKTSLKQFDVDTETFQVSIPSDPSLPISMSWRMDNGIDNFIAKMLDASNMGGNINFKLSEKSSSTRNIPVNLKVNSFKAHGQMKFNNPKEFLGGWKNGLDFPMIPTKINILRHRVQEARLGRNPQTGKQIFINERDLGISMETIELNQTKIAPDETFVPADRLANKLSNMKGVMGIYMDYDLIETCEECNQKVKRRLIGGTSGSEITSIEIQILNALEFSEAEIIKVLIKSTQADPSGVQEIELPPFQVSEDGQTIGDIQLFVPQGNELSYDYKVKLVMENGRVLQSKWKTLHSNLLVIGERQIKKLFPDKWKDETVDKIKNGAIKKVKEEVFGKDATEEVIIDRTLTVLGNLFKKKDTTRTKSNAIPKNSDEETEKQETDIDQDR